MNLVSRTQCRSLAKTIVYLEQEIGSELDAKVMVGYLNQQYDLVKPSDTKRLAILTSQVELEVFAERHAAKNSFPAATINPIGLAMAVVDRETGKLKRNVEGDMVSN